VPWYSVYTCADGQWISIGALEPQFWALLVEKLGLTDLGDRSAKSTWEATRATLRETFLSQPRAHWDALLAGTDACYAPVLSPAEARTHPHMAARNAFTTSEADQPAQAPRFQNANPTEPEAPRAPGADSWHLLTELGLPEAEIESLISSGAIATAPKKKAAE